MCNFQRSRVSLLAIGLLAIAGCNRSTTLESRSPDGTTVVRLVEFDRTASIDRNFEIVLLTSDGKEVIYESPDEGRPPGTERCIWSIDSKAFVIVGKHFYVDDTSLKTPASESIYLSYSIPSRTLLSNARQRSDEYKELTPMALEGLRLTEPVLKSETPN